MAQGQTIRRLSGLPFFSGASATIYTNDPVTVSGVWTVKSVADVKTRPDGTARHESVNGEAVDVRNTNDVVRGIAAATVAAGETVGYSAKASGYVELAPVAQATGSVVWSVGVAVEHANTGQEFGYIYNPRQLSDLS